MLTKQIPSLEISLFFSRGINDFTDGHGPTDEEEQLPLVIICSQCQVIPRRSGDRYTEAPVKEEPRSTKTSEYFL